MGARASSFFYATDAENRIVSMLERNGIDSTKSAMIPVVTRAGQNPRVLLVGTLFLTISHRIKSIHLVVHRTYIPIA